MLVGIPKTWWRMLLQFRGSSIQHTWKRLLFTTLLAVAVTALWETYDFERYSLSTTPFSLIGLALGIFLGFRNNASYDRFWEARKLWGRMVNTSRTWTRQVETLINAPSDASEDEIAAIAALKTAVMAQSWTRTSARRRGKRSCPRPTDRTPSSTRRRRSSAMHGDAAGSTTSTCPCSSPR